MSKKNTEFSIGYIQKVINNALGVEQKGKIMENIWTGYIENAVKNTTVELSSKKNIAEDFLFGLLKK
jgi:hypothetical protein